MGSHLRSARCSRSGFHAWTVRAPSKRARSDEEFGARVRASFISSYRTYGARRVWHDLLAEGLSCGLHRIEWVMRVHGLRARPRRPGLPKDDGLRSVIADNILDRQFTAEAPNQRWIADFTYIWTAEGRLYVAVVIDLFSRRMVDERHQRACEAPGVDHVGADHDELGRRPFFCVCWATPMTFCFRRASGR